MAGLLYQPGVVPLLQVDGLTKSFGGVHAVREVSFCLAPGEILALIGPNGAGKSTCFNMLAGQLKPDSGSVRLAGHDVTGLDARRIWREGVGRTFQITATCRSMTVRENVQVGLLSHHGEIGRMFGFAGARHIAEAERLLGIVGLADLATRPCAELAYGDLKRLELALALVHGPKLLLLDEPTAGMAPRDRVAMMRVTVAIARREGLGIVFTEHDMDVVFEHADRLTVLNRGRLVASGSPAEIRRDPVVREIYLGQGATYGHGADGVPAA